MRVPSIRFTSICSSCENLSPRGCGKDACARKVTTATLIARKRASYPRAVVFLKFAGQRILECRLPPVEVLLACDLRVEGLAVIQDPGHT